MPVSITRVFRRHLGAPEAAIRPTLIYSLRCAFIRPYLSFLKYTKAMVDAGLVKVRFKTGGCVRRNQQCNVCRGEFLIQFACLGTRFSTFVESSAQRWTLFPYTSLLDVWRAYMGIQRHRPPVGCTLPVRTALSPPDLNTSKRFSTSGSATQA